ncbi:MAG TPA: hypothetical protein VHG29_08590 [Novosphingobium sp.]|nr:hypothetical protein [Novosphingobium sp.]
MNKSAIVKATLVAGTLDILFAIVMTLKSGGDILAMLRGVAAGPFGDATQDWGVAGSIAGLLVHFAMMAIMAAALAVLLRQPRVASMNWIVVGILYGLATYLVMYGIVLPLRFGSHFPQTDPARIASALFAHVGLVGLLMTWIFRRTPQRA